MFRYFANQSEYTDLKNSGKRIDLNGVAVKTPMHCPPGGKEKPHFMVISLSGDKWKFQTADMVGAKAWEKAIQARIEACISQNLSRGAKNNVTMINTQKYACLTPEQRSALAGG